MTRKLQFLLTALLLTAGVTRAWADGVNLLTNSFEASATTNCSVSTTDSKVTVTPSGSGQFRITLAYETGVSISTDKAFFVVEMDNTDFSTDNLNLRNVKFGDTTYDATGNQAVYDNGDKKIIIYSSLMAYSSNSLGTAYQGNSSLTLKSVALNFKASDTSARTIYSAGFYSLADILNTFSTLKTSKDWQYVSVANLRIEVNGTGGNTVKIKDTSGGAATIAQTKLFIKSIGLSDLPAAYTTLNFGNLRPSESTTEDLFSGFGTRTLKLSHTQMHKVPTKYANLQDTESNTSWYRFVDGSTTAPSEVSAVTTGTGENNWGTYTRELKSGYNTVLMPFKKLAGSDYQSSDLTFYKVNSYSEGTATFAKVENTYSSNTFLTDIKEAEIVTGYAFNPFIIYTEKPGLYTFVGRDVVTPATYYTGYKEKRFGSTNLYMVGTFEDECPMASGKNYETYTCYGIASNGTSVKKMKADTKASYYRAFIVDKSSSPAPILNISFDNLNGTTDIISIKDVDGMNRMSNDNAIYNLQGVRMNADNLPKGIYVKNGKKFVIK